MNESFAARRYENRLFGGEYQERLRAEESADRLIALLISGVILFGLLAMGLAMECEYSSPWFVPALLASLVAGVACVACVAGSVYVARRYDIESNHRKMAIASGSKILQSIQIQKTLKTITTYSVSFGCWCSTSYFLSELKGFSRTGDPNVTYGILSIGSSSSGYDVTHRFVEINEALGDAFSSEQIIPRVIGSACVAAMDGEHLSSISIAGESGQRVAIAMMPRHPGLMKYILDYNAEVMVVWVKTQLPIFKKNEKINTENIVQKVAENLHRMVPVRGLPANLIILLADYCTSDDGIHCLDAFYSWLWAVSGNRSSTFIPSIADNAWLLQECVRVSVGADGKLTHPAD
ncbi:hypothetical protein [Pseudomonas sp.]|uniref:hypothetical protein n=1 Tax=Pseudomonas sp. TaxID=306 RepID=UPI002732B943|nr:hypothetical protein [Pseudomonas sp.]MDP2745970.1 hypothetical protein [Pseudomonas sp.]